MPKLLSMSEYRFVPSGFVHPLGYKVETITTDAELPELFGSIEQLAQRQAEIAEWARLRAHACRERFHPAHSFEAKGLGEIQACYLHPVEKRYRCAVQAKNALDATRTAERTVLVKIELPL